MECTFVDICRARAEDTPDRPALSFSSGPGNVTEWTYARLDRRARAVAAALQERCAPGDRVVLLHPPGLEYIAAFLGCLYAGVIAVPAYPPYERARSESDIRLAGILSDAAPAALAVDSSVAGADWAPDLPVIATDTVPDEAADTLKPVLVRLDDVAFLQYTSGSVKTPRGVRVTHRNLAANSRAISREMGHDVDCQGVIWLPPYHDMGLIGGILQPLYVGFPCTLMSPLSVLRSPMLWLTEISGRRRVTSGGPNFAFDACVRRTSPEERASLDLSGWDVAFCGAEPIRAQTLRAFAEAFAASGFRVSSFFPCYGLAEATLMVTGNRVADGPRELSVDSAALEQGKVVPRDGDGSQVLVGCGAVIADHELRIVDPTTGLPCEPGRVGEIWVRGPSIADGYHGHGRAESDVFNARLPGEPDARYLRTGDLGFVKAGELFVTGRARDLIVIQGRNIYPHDLEGTIKESDPAFHRGTCAVFGVEGGDGTEIVVVQEVRKDLDETHARELLTKVRSALVSKHRVIPSAIVFAPFRSVPKTSSGKIARLECRRRYLTGALKPLMVWRLTDPPTGTTPMWMRHDQIADLVSGHVGSLLGLDGDAIPRDTGFMELGLDSIRAVEVRNRLQESLSVSLPPGVLFDYPTVNALTGHLADLLDARSSASASLTDSET